MGKDVEAEKLYEESLAIEERQTPASSERIGRRLAELALIYGEQKRFSKGSTYVERLIPISDNYKGNEKKIIAKIFYVYSQELPQYDSGNLTRKLADKAIEMGFDPVKHTQQSSAKAGGSE